VEETRRQYRLRRVGRNRTPARSRSSVSGSPRSAASGRPQLRISIVKGAGQAKSAGQPQCHGFQDSNRPKIPGQIRLNSRERRCRQRRFWFAVGQELGDEPQGRHPRTAILCHNSFVRSPAAWGASRPYRQPMARSLPLERLSARPYRHLCDLPTPVFGAKEGRPSIYHRYKGDQAYRVHHPDG
jgi:hypothetical protein